MNIPFLEVAFLFTAASAFGWIISLMWFKLADVLEEQNRRSRFHKLFVFHVGFVSTISIVLAIITVLGVLAMAFLVMWHGFSLLHLVTK